MTAQRTRKDWDRLLQSISDAWYAEAEKIVVAMDDLHPPSMASLNETFAPAEAKRLADRLDIHYIPQHGSWLPMAELEIGIGGRPGLDRRLDNADLLPRAIAAWATGRHARRQPVERRFTGPTPASPSKDVTRGMTQHECR